MNVLRARPSMQPTLPMPSTTPQPLQANPGSYAPQSRGRPGFSAINNRELSRDFWNMAQKMPRQKMLDMVGDVTLKQALDGGLNSHNRVFLESFRDHLTHQELQQLSNQLRSDPRLRQRLPLNERRQLLQELQRIWKSPSQREAQDPNAATNQFFFREARTGNANPVPLSPAQIDLLVMPVAGSSLS